jgi:ABC-type transport system involved in cytochrome c biogenesis permease component
MFFPFLIAILFFSFIFVLFFNATVPKTDVQSNNHTQGILWVTALIALNYFVLWDISRWFFKCFAPTPHELLSLQVIVTYALVTILASCFFANPDPQINSY